LAFAIGLLLLWRSESRESPGGHATTRASRHAEARPLAASPTPPFTSPTQRPLARPTLPSTPSAPAPDPSPTQSPSSADPSEPDTYFRGRVLGPDGSPLRTKVYVFETGPHVARSFSSYGDSTPTEVEAIARVLTRGQGKLLTSTRSSPKGWFRFQRKGLAQAEVVLVARGPACSGGLLLQAGTRTADLQLEARRPLRILFVTSRPLRGATLSVYLGRAGELTFPTRDDTTCEVMLPAIQPKQLRLQLFVPGWVSANRTLRPAERQAGLVTWKLPLHLELRGRVLDPEGRPWVAKGLDLRYRETEEHAWNWVEAITDAEGVFVVRGIPPGRSLEVEVPGNRSYAYYRAAVSASAAPLTIRLQKPSVLRVQVGGNEAEIRFSTLDVSLERREGERWDHVPEYLYGHPDPRNGGLPPDEGDDDFARGSGLREGTNKLFGLPPGRYRITLGGLASRVLAEPVEVELVSGKSASCVLRPKRKVLTRFHGFLAHPGSELAGQQVSISYDLESASVMYSFELDSRAGFSFRAHLLKATKAKLSLPDLRLSVEILLDPENPDLGTLALEQR
jgi:hypothetical protein